MIIFSEDLRTVHTWPSSSICLAISPLISASVSELPNKAMKVSNLSRINVGVLIVWVIRITGDNRKAEGSYNRLN